MENKEENGFHKALFISIPDDEDNPQNNNESTSNSTTHEIQKNPNFSPPPSPKELNYLDIDNCLSKNLLERIDNGTPVNKKHITLKDEQFVINEENKDKDENDYIFEKFGKRGWQCEKCNNFNFESRKICNRCGVNKQPKSIKKIKEEEMNKIKENKKRQFIERVGDWKCPLCYNLNFAFRQICNRCGLPKYQSVINNNNDSSLWKYPSNIDKHYFLMLDVKNIKTNYFPYENSNSNSKFNFSYRPLDSSSIWEKEQ